MTRRFEVKFKFKIKWLFISTANKLVPARKNILKKILSRELNSIVCSTSVSSYG